LKEWLVDVWDDLHSKKPTWLTDEAIRMIPLDLIPNINHLGVQGEMDEEDLLEFYRKEREKSSARATIGRVARTTLGSHRGGVSLRNPLRRTLGVQSIRASLRASLGMTTSTNDDLREDVAREITDSVIAELSVRKGGDK